MFIANVTNEKNETESLIYNLPFYPYLYSSMLVRDGILSPLEWVFIYQPVMFFLMHKYIRHYSGSVMCSPVGVNH